MRKSASVVAAIGRAKKTPALFTRMSRPPKVERERNGGAPVGLACDVMLDVGAANLFGDFGAIADV